MSQIAKGGRPTSSFADSDGPAARKRGTRSRPMMVMRRGKLVRRDEPSPTPVAAEEEAQVQPAAAVGWGRKMLIVAAIVALYLPYSLHLGPLRLTPISIYLLIGFLPFCGFWLFGRRTVTPNAVDWLILGFGLWAVLAIGYHHGFLASFEPIGILLIQTIGAFAAGRVLVRDSGSMRFMIVLVAGIVTLTLPFIVAESLTGRPIVLQLLSTLAPTVPPVEMGERLGLRRSQGFFEHPILFGIFAASLFAMNVYASKDGRKLFVQHVNSVAILIASVLTLSTGALLSLNVQLGLMLWRKVFRAVARRWTYLMILLASLYLTVDLLSTRSPFHVFVQYATFSSGSSYNRILIWEFGTAEVLRHPLLGIGFGEWQRPSYMSGSMDNFWLVQAVRYGLPAFLMLFGALILLLVRMGKARSTDESINLMRTGVSFSLIATAVAIGSVHLWNSTYIWLMFLIGSSVWLIDTPKAIGKPGKRSRP